MKVCLKTAHSNLSTIKYFVGKFKLEERKTGDAGRNCIFVSVSDKVGVKLYKTKIQRDICFKNQMKAAEHGLGPEVYGKIKKFVYKGIVLYGYITEVVEIIDTDYYFSNKEKVQNLKYDIQWIGLYSGDFFEKNIGIKDGKLICIDFDDDKYRPDSSMSETIFQIERMNSGPY